LLTLFTQKTDFLQVRCNFTHKKRTLCIFEPSFGGLGVTYSIHPKLIGKRVVLIALFHCNRVSLTKLSGRRNRPDQPFFSSEN